MCHQGREASPESNGIFFLEPELHRIQVWQIGMYKLY